MTSAVATERVNIKELAFRLRVSRQTIYNWRDAGCPIEEGIEAIKAWLAERREEDDSDDELSQRLKLAEVLKAEEDARKKRLDNDTKEGALEYREDVIQRESERLLRIKHRLESVPDEIRNEFPAEFRDLAQQLVADKIHLLLTEMSHWELHGETGV